MLIFKRKYLMITFALQMVCMSHTICQAGFQSIIGDGSNYFDHLNIDDILYHQDRLVVRGNVFSEHTGRWGLLIAGLDTTGQLLWHGESFDSTGISHFITNTPTSFSIRSYGDILVPNKYFNGNRLALTKFDSVGNEIFTTEFEHIGKTIFPKTVIELRSSYYLFGRVQRNDFENDVYMLKTDTLGKMIWIKYFGLENFGERFGDVILNDNETFTVSSDRYTNDFNNGTILRGWKSPWIFTIDTAGIIIDEWLGAENDTRTLGGGPFWHMPNGDWVIVAEDFSEIEYGMASTQVVAAPTITRLDSTFALKWKRTLTSFTGIWDIIFDLEYDSNRDEIVIAGDRNVYYSEDDLEREIWVLKFDRDGELLWEITDSIYYNMLELHSTAGVEIAPSGSIYVGGYVKFFDLSQGWILKISPDGCVDTICTTTSLADQIRAMNQNILLYPNPAIDEISISIKSLQGDGVISIFDLQGRWLFKHEISEGVTQISPGLLSGVYIYSISDKRGIIHTARLVVI